MRDVAIGALDTRLALEAPSEVSDGGGGSTGGWTMVAQLWANVAPLSGSDAAQSDAIRSQASHRIIIRRREGITTAMRLRDGTRIYAIGAILDHGRRDRLELLCRQDQG